jgi:hypothetical protein
MEDAVVSRDYVTLAEGVIASDYALKNLNKSLGEAQNEFGSAVKSEENKWGGYKYTPLESIVKAVRPSLAKHHLTISQFPLTDLQTKTVSMLTRLVHWDSGEWVQHTLDLPGELALGKDGAAKFNQQTIGGSSTYAQKYAYKAILGVPDAEEMIDSTEEKGDLPARSKAQRGRSQQSVDDAVAQKSTQGWNERQAQGGQTQTPAPQTGVRSQFFGKAKEFGWGLGDIKEYMKRAYPEAQGSTANLTEDQINEALALMAQHKPEAILQTEQVQ